MMYNQAVHFLGRIVRFGGSSGKRVYIERLNWIGVYPILEGGSYPKPEVFSNQKDCLKVTEGRIDYVLNHSITKPGVLSVFRFFDGEIRNVAEFKQEEFLESVKDEIEESFKQGLPHKINASEISSSLLYTLHFGVAA